MSSGKGEKLAQYYCEGESWATQREQSRRRLLSLAWTIAGVMTVVAICEAAALVALTPLKTSVPYTLLVDRQTGSVQALKPLERSTVAPDAALTRSFLAQYVIAREGFDIDSLKDDYRKVILWTAGAERNRYAADMQASNPASPLSTLPRQAVRDVQIRSISSLNGNSALVRFDVVTSNLGNGSGTKQPFVAVIRFEFTSAVMSEAERLINPLGFQVLRYRCNAELPPASPSQERMPPSMPSSDRASTPQRMSR